MLTTLANKITLDKDSGKLYDELTSKKKKKKKGSKKDKSHDGHHHAVSPTRSHHHAVSPTHNHHHHGTDKKKSKEEEEKAIRRHKHQQKAAKLQIIEQTTKARLAQITGNRHPSTLSPSDIHHTDQTDEKHPSDHKDTDTFTILPDTATLVNVIRDQVISEMVSQEVKQNKKKLELLDNKMKNAMKQSAVVGSGGPKVHHYSAAEEAAKLKQKIEYNLSKHFLDTKSRPIIVSQPHPLIASLLYYASLSKLRCEEIIYSENFIYHLLRLDIRIICASLDCYLSDRMKSPLNYKVECLWRVAVIMGDYQNILDHVIFMKKISLYIYQLLIALIGQEKGAKRKKYPIPYQALLSSLEQIQEELDVLECRLASQNANSPLVFIPPNFDTQQMFFFAN